MTRPSPRVFSIPPGVPFLTTLAKALIAGDLVPGFRFDGDPLRLADATIYVPTRRAARELRGVFVEIAGGKAAILPTIRALGEFDEDDEAFELEQAGGLDLPPAIAPIERVLLLAPLVRAWKRRLPAHLAAKFAEDVVVPASSSDALWLARDLAALIDEMETEGSDWSGLNGLVAGNLAGWWQVTLDFLEIVTRQWPEVLAELDRSNPAAHRSARIRAEAARLRRSPPAGPVIAAGSTGSIPATAELLSAIAGLPAGAVVLPGLDGGGEAGLDAASWAVLQDRQAAASVFGHPQYGLARLLGTIGVGREAVERIGLPSPALARRTAILAQALRPAETTDMWPQARRLFGEQDIASAFAGVTYVEAAIERDEALAIAITLRMAVAEPGRHAALVTGDRDLARRVAVELKRFGIHADDSGGTPLQRTAPGQLLAALVGACLAPGDPVAILDLLKQPLIGLGFERQLVRRAMETIELVALRGGTGRPDIATLDQLFESRLATFAAGRWPPFWLSRLDPERIGEARQVLAALAAAAAPLVGLREDRQASLSGMAHATVVAFEAFGRGAGGDVAALYEGNAGERLAGFLRSLLAAEARFELAADEWPDVFAALIAPEIVKPSPGADSRVSIWGALEARLQSVDTLVLGGLNEGSWPRKAEADRFLSRLMKGGLALDPPERRIGLAAHDFMMAMGAPNVVITRAARSGEAPAVASRWLQRLLTFIGADQADAMRQRGHDLLAWARSLDAGRQPFARRPNPAPPLAARPRRLSVTEVETLRRDPYAVYARRILNLHPLEPLLRDPGAAERGTLFHDILHRFARAGVDPYGHDAVVRLLDFGRTAFAEAALPADVEAVWWPRFVALAANFVGWERERGESTLARHSEARAEPFPVGLTGVTLSAYADRIDAIAAGYADVIDFKTGSSPSKGQAHTLLAPQLALEAALLTRGAFAALGPLKPSKLAYVRLKANGNVEEESVLEFNRKVRSAPDLADEAWERLTRLLDHYNDPATGYKSRALPFREADLDGDYDHLARVLEWSAGADDETEIGDLP